MPSLKTSVNYLELVNDLVKKITQPGLTTDSLCQYISVRTLDCLNVAGTYINKLDKDGITRTVTTCGVSEEMLQSWIEVPFSDSLPGNDAMRTDKMVWLADYKDWVDNYPDLAKYVLNEESKTFIAVPIDMPGASVAAFGIMSSSIHKQTKELTSFIWTIGGLISLYFTNANQDESEYLTPRELEILEYMYQGYTNAEIAKELGFSESTIRHETMRIYQIMNVTGRKEAVAAAIKLNLIKDSGARTA